VEHDAQSTQTLANLEARLSARALGAMAGALLREDIATPPHAELQAALRFLLTPQLSKLLRNARPEVKSFCLIATPLGSLLFYF
jgi:hypothetical protein